MQQTSISNSSGTWKPRWFVDIGGQCQIGIDIDDHCFVVLTKNVVGSWTPSQWIPPIVAVRLGELAQTELVL